MVLTSPPLVGGALATALDGDPSSWRIWRTTLTSSVLHRGDSPEQSTTLRRLGDDGIEQLAAYGPFTLVFDPPLLEIPADVHDGSRWDGSGDATTDGTLTYSSGFRAAASDRDDCLQVTGSVVFRSGGDTVLTSDTDETWCEGAGIVPDHAARVPAYDDEIRAPAPDVDADDVAGWRVHRRPVVYADSRETAADTGGEATLTVDHAPASLPEHGLAVVDATGDDVLGLARDHGALVRTWVGHPGGVTTGLATSGDVTVAVTTRRQAVGYGEHGQWLWTRDLPDVPVTDPLAVDREHLVLTTAGGDVVVVDPRTGDESWRHRLTDQVRTPPVSDRDLVVAGDVAGRVTAWDLATGDQVWSVDTGAVLALGESDGVVVVLTDGVAHGYRADDGDLLWSRQVAGAGGEAVVDLGTAVVVATADEVVGLDPDDGEERWRAAGADVSAGLDGLLVQVTGHRLTVRDADGRAVDVWALPGLRGDVDRVAVSDTGVWVMDGSGRTVEVGP
jgi:outer membrane protein assembly factor BamB